MNKKFLVYLSKKMIINLFILEFLKCFKRNWELGKEFSIQFGLCYWYFEIQRKSQRFMKIYEIF